MNVDNMYINMLERHGSCCDNNRIEIFEGVVKSPRWATFQVSTHCCNRQTKTKHKRGGSANNQQYDLNNAIFVKFQSKKSCFNDESMTVTLEMAMFDSYSCRRHYLHKYSSNLRNSFVMVTKLHQMKV